MHPLNSERYVHTFKDITNFSGTINVTYRYLAGTPLPRKSIIYLFLFGVFWHVFFDVLVIYYNSSMQNNVQIKRLLVFSAMIHYLLFFKQCGFQISGRIVNSQYYSKTATCLSRLYYFCIYIIFTILTNVCGHLSHMQVFPKLLPHVWNQIIFKNVFVCCKIMILFYWN